MTMPAQFAALDDQRAAITSRLVTTDFLRHELGFDGLVVSDDLNMYGARLGLTEEQSVGVEALKAGADFLLFVGISLEDLDTLIARIQAELQSGTISETDFAASTKRILRFKQRYCLDEAKTELGPVDVADLLTRVGRPEDAAMSMEHATRAVVLLQDNGILPLSGQRVLCVGPSSLLPDPASGWSWLLERSFCESLHEVDPQSDVLDFVIGGGEGVVQYRLEQAWDAYDVVVVATFQAWFSPPQQDLLDWIIETSTIPVVHVSQGVPFDAIWTKGRVAASLALMGSLPVMFQAGSKVLYGLAEAGGTMLFGL
jgi:beta-N-acetylhexosaminidase